MQQAGESSPSALRLPDFISATRIHRKRTKMQIAVIEDITYEQGRNVRMTVMTNIDSRIMRLPMDVGYDAFAKHMKAANVPSIAACKGRGCRIARVAGGFYFDSLVRVVAG